MGVPRAIVWRCGGIVFAAQPVKRIHKAQITRLNIQKTTGFPVRCFVGTE